MLQLSFRVRQSCGELLFVCECMCCDFFVVVYFVLNESCDPISGRSETYFCFLPLATNSSFIKYFVNLYIFVSYDNQWDWKINTHKRARNLSQLRLLPFTASESSCSFHLLYLQLLFFVFVFQVYSKACCSCSSYHSIIGSPRWEKTFKIIQSNCLPITN